MISELGSSEMLTGDLCHVNIIESQTNTSQMRICIICINTKTNIIYLLLKNSNLNSIM